ncbi:MAG TPA: 3-oxoacyl-[acyl-carrier-protein] synthase III C-terminal domain-containing protein [Prolixibacteraceae bacterium]|mgnify:CR=1 FL=1|nr:3-oxoacyl-[acyl-carrier-protein] synthase III C-terminal domain-containing protein [Prolixibacteraceae bacterium]
MRETLSKAGFVSISAYLPAKKLSVSFAKKLVSFLRSHTLLPEEYIRFIEDEGVLPGSVETNEDGWISKPWYDAWVKSLSEKKQKDPFQGAEERRRVPLDPDSVRSSIYPHPMLPSDAETLAGAMAICCAGIDPDSIDLVISHSQVPDRPLPENASLIQHKLKLRNAGAYGVDTCCSSFVTMTEIACSLISSGVKKNILIISSFIDSHVIDRSTHFSVDTGDASVAAIISTPVDGKGFLASHSTSHGSRHDGIIYQRRTPLLLKRIDSGPDYSQTFVTFFNPAANKEIAQNAAIDLKYVVDKSLEKAGLSVSDIDFLLTHQPVVWAGDVWRESIGVSPERFYQSFKKYGNIATCSAAVNLLESIELGLVKENDKVIFASSGAGENHISLVMELSSQLINNVLKTLSQTTKEFSNEFSRN